MKTKYIFLTFLFLVIIYSHNAKTKNFQHLHVETDFDTYYKNPFVPIKFTTSGLHNFFENIYNKNWYAKEFLPDNFTHMIQFLQFGKKTNQGGPFLKSVLKLFGNKLKAASYVNSYALLDLLEVLPDLTRHCFTLPEKNFFEENKKAINNVMYKSFVSNFSLFKLDPKDFLDNLSENILSTLQNQANIVDTHVNLEHFRQSLVRFIELALGKTIWSPQDHENIWSLFRSISKSIEKLSKQKIIEDIDNLDDMLWSLVHRFCDFLDIIGHKLPVEFYQKFKNKLLSSKLFIFQIEEQEKSITTKEAQLMQALFEGEAKARAYQKGIIIG